jgi:uncharacterized protein YjdB
MATIFVLDDVKTAKVAWKDAKGRTAVIDTKDQDVKWESSNDGVVTVVPNEGNMSAVVTAVGVGKAQITVTADADLDAGEMRELVLIGEVEVIPAEAMAGEVSFE